MTVGTNYSTPISVNGYLCKNCTDVDLAKKHIDPAHPRSGPYGINAKSDPTINKTAAVTFGGALGSLNGKLTAPIARPSDSMADQIPNVSGTVTGTHVDLQV